MNARGETAAAPSSAAQGGTPAHARVMIVLGSIFPAHMELWRACRRAGADITVVGSTFNPYAGKLPWIPEVPSDLECIILSPLGFQRETGYLKWWYPGLGRTIHTVKPDIIHVVSEPWGLLVIESAIIRSLRRMNVRLCVHGCDNIYHYGNAIERLTRKAILRGIEPRLDGFVSWNAAGIDLAKSTGLPTSTPTAVIPGIVPDPDRLAPPSPLQRRDLRTKLNLPQDEVVIGFFGRLVPEKGVLDAIQAIGRLQSGAHFLAIWGAGPLGREVDEVMSQRSMRGRFGGMLDFPDVPDAVRACDIVVVPSRTVPHWAEQFGRIVVEAMLAGCAVVAYRSGALPEVVADGGILIDEGDVDGLSAAVERLVRDPIFRERTGAAGRRSALARYHPRLLALQLIAFWDEVLQR
jgi:glycosyltransferase involved in cell wall biosynthesis